MEASHVAHMALAALLSLASPAAARQAPAVPNGATLLEWSGWEVGQTVTFEDTRGERYCVRIGNPREVQDRTWIPLQGLPWPTLASDSQVLLAHDGTLGLAVVRTPGPRPFLEPLHEPAPGTLRFLEGVTPDQARAMALEDGWYAFGNSAGAPTTLVYLWCAQCADAGTVVRFERGQGLVAIKETTIGGTEKLHLVDDACDLPEVEFELYVEPSPGRVP
ncbi:MAG TPA: hypothetical protein VJP59_05100 [Gemmatimonadota bacterium]|nr:hypothetical protein [Gemmatimonadota bacterium]